MRWPSGTGDINAYLVRPAEVDADRPPAAVLVVHENRGLNPYIRDVVRRLGKAGFIAMGPEPTARSARPGFAMAAAW